MQISLYMAGSALVVLLGILFGASYSEQVFEQPVTVVDVAIPPRFLIRRRPFLLGKSAFVGFCLTVYAFALVFYREIPGLIQFAPAIVQAELADVIKAIDDGTHPSLLLTAVAITIGFFYVLKSDFPGNVVYRFRSFIYSSISVPIAFKRTWAQLLDNLTVPEPQRTALVEDAELHITLPDFELSRADVNRQWAELAYMNSWIKLQKDGLPGGEIISDASFDFSKSRNQFIALRELVHLLKSAQSNAESYAAMTEILTELRSDYARCASYLLLTQSAGRLEFYEECRKIGIDPGVPFVGNPLAYSAQYVITLAITVILGPYLFAVGYDVFSSVDIARAVFKQNTDYMQRWLVSGLAAYFSPIFLILLIRYIAWRISPIRTCTSLVTYAWTLIGAFVISTIGGTIASTALHGGAFADWQKLLQTVWVTMPWSIGPALTSLYINYYLDRQADPAKEDIVQTRKTIAPRLLSAFAFTAAIVVISLLIVAHQRLVGSVWPRVETQIIVVGTIALITFSLCLVAQFGLRKRPSAAEPPSLKTALAEL